ncbi:unnamed protein product [Phaedon cochleariae]|uniref:Peptidase S1 domain-containing protein n=1 Tax=Phaedon cochleariae TaxID=80249 RepID=A0A9P0DI18_PHACE|nr:unnamed protein product [Phaedon cochleariae]
MFVRLSVLSLVLLSKEVSNQDVSPCPDVFSYEPQKAENDRWYGSASLQTTEDLTGVWLVVELDRPAELLGNWFGETYSTDNQLFRITNPDYKLEAGPPVSVRFFVQYDPSRPIPSLKTMRLNGRTICSSKIREGDLIPTTPRLHISHPSKTTRRPAISNDVDGGSRPMFSSSNDNNRRPGSSSRPGMQPNSNHYVTSSSVSTRPDTTDASYFDSNGNVDRFRPNNIGNGNHEQTISNQSPSHNREPISSNSGINGYDSSINQPGYVGTGYGEQSGTVSLNNQGQNSYIGNPEGTGDIQGVITRPVPTRPTRRPTGSNNNGPSTDEPSYTYPADLDYFPGDFSGVKKPAHHRPSQSSDRTSSSDRMPSCGTIATHAAPLISNGQDTIPGQWPWHAALYHSKGIQLIYICGATLISERHVVTAAHCVTKPNTAKPVDTESILVYLGKYNLITFGPEVQDRDISDIFVNPQYNHSSYFNDIAILKMSRAVDINNYVRPCCLWEDDVNLETIISRQGTVVGWGFDENKKLSNKLMQAQMPVVSTLTCIYSNRDFFSRFTSDKNFCAGFRNGTSVCNGDSGGSMVFPRRGIQGQTTVWQIRGIVSVGVALQGEGVCDTSQYIIFTDVAKYLVWIRQTLLI